MSTAQLTAEGIFAQGNQLLASKLTDLFRASRNEFKQ
jgi:hypothetical protein